MSMKLDAALKLYMALYVLCFALTWLISVPMLMHVNPRSECLLFVNRYVQYGNSFGEFQTSNAHYHNFPNYKIQQCFFLYNLLHLLTENYCAGIEVFNNHACGEGCFRICPANQMLHLFNFEKKSHKRKTKWEMFLILHH